MCKKLTHTKADSAPQIFGLSEPSLSMKAEEEADTVVDGFKI